MSNKPQANPKEIDKILASDEMLLPSSGFLSAVMERVEEEASAPPPIPFPWKRAVPGIVLAGGVFGWGAVELVRGIPAAGRMSLTLPHLALASGRPMEQVEWIALALAVSVGSLLVSRMVAKWSGML